MSHHRHTQRLEIVADSDPALLSRVCGTLANRSVTPERFQAAVDADDGTLRFVIVTSGWTGPQVELIERKLSQLLSVRTVSSKIGESAQ